MSRKPLRVHFKTKLTERQSVRFVCCYRTTRTILAGKRWQATGGDGPASTACWDSSGVRSNASSRRYRICQSVVLPPAELRLPRGLRGMYPRLHTLDVSRNRLRQLPSAVMAALPQLQVLDCSRNLLEGALPCDGQRTLLAPAVADQLLDLRLQLGVVVGRGLDELL